MVSRLSRSVAPLYPIAEAARFAVTLNPEVEYGLPAVRRVRTETILHRFLARESAEEVADDFGLEVASVERALRYEWSLTCAA